MYEDRIHFTNYILQVPYVNKMSDSISLRIINPFTSSRHGIWSEICRRIGLFYEGPGLGMVSLEAGQAL